MPCGSTTSGTLFQSNLANATSLAADSTGQLIVGSGGGGGFTSINVQTFTTSGTYTPTAGMLYCIVECVGGGGGGGGCLSSGAGNDAGAGGGGGGYSRKTISSSTIGASQSVTIGAGGTGGASGGANTGATGGTSSLGVLLTATGGTGGTGATHTATTGISGNPGAGGTGTDGDFNANGSPGGIGFWIGPAPAYTYPGCGGSSFFGGGASSISSGVVSGGTSGNNGVAYGGGGSGAWDNYQGNVVAGGNGFAGIVIITEYVIA